MTGLGRWGMYHICLEQITGLGHRHSTFDITGLGRWGMYHICLEQITG